ncbi:unnamed protein product, partial [Rotaria sp. Silwood2]
GLLVNVTTACQSIYQLNHTDCDPLCSFRGFLLHGLTGLMYHTLLIQALYRLFVNVFATRRFLQSKKFTLIIVIVQWLLSNTFGLPIFFAGRIRYQAGSRICLVSLNDISGFFYLAVWIYLVPVSLLTLIYAMIVRHVTINAFSNTNRQAIFQRRQQKREIQLVRRILILVTMLIVIGIPYCSFWLHTWCTGLSPPYAERLSYIFIAFGYGASMLYILVSTSKVRNILIDIYNKRYRGRRVECANITNTQAIQMTVQCNT